MYLILKYRDEEKFGAGSEKIRAKKATYQVGELKAIVMRSASVTLVQCAQVFQFQWVLIAAPNQRR